MEQSSLPYPGFVEERMKIRIPANSGVMESPSEAEMMIQAPWSVGVTIEYGGYCPGGTVGVNEDIPLHTHHHLVKS
jgi:hypothetical protein